MDAEPEVYAAESVRRVEAIAQSVFFQATARGTDDLRLPSPERADKHLRREIRRLWEGNTGLCAVRKAA